MGRSEASPELAHEVRAIAEAAKAAGRALAIAPTDRKNAVLLRVARSLREASAAVLARNAEDVARGERVGLSAAMIDRLALDSSRVESIARSIEEVARLPDPVGSIEAMARRPNGLLIGKMRVPLGLIAIVYESRPNVTAEAASLCIKSGNACLLRSGSEALGTSAILADLFVESLRAEGFDPAAVSLLRDPDREAMRAVLGLSGVVDLLIPRGGEGLIRFVTEHARVPVIQHYKGVCHVYVDGDADLEMAERIAVDAKVRRPGVCNAMETLLVDRACAPRFVPRIVEVLRGHGVEVRADVEAHALASSTTRATDADWDTEHLAFVLSLAIVDGMDGALAHVARHGSNHTEAIVTGSYDKAQRWLREVDASLVLVNASTRFNDGGQLGLGAEMGIATSKLHAYGPMGLEELCARKWIAMGDGQTRG